LYGGTNKSTGKNHGGINVRDSTKKAMKLK